LAQTVDRLVCMMRVVRVVNAADQPLSGARVAIVRGTVPMPEIGLQAGPDGVLRLNLPDGIFTLRAFAPTGNENGETTVSGGDTGPDILIRVRTSNEDPGRRH